jgi:isoquinoline 1-oxidoreductase alpha subunit
MPTRFTLNGKSAKHDGDPEMPLLWAIRDDFGLTGTKYGEATPSCVTPVALVAGKSVTTIEGLDSPVGRAVQKAWIAIDVPQCGYCQSGQIMSATALLTAQKVPSDADIDAGMARNICRCATYLRIRKAIHLAAESVKA